MVRRLFDVASLEQYVDQIESGRPFSRPTCLITFDDGWHETRTILKKYNVPAVVFLPVNFIGSTRTFWQEQLGLNLFRVAARARTDPSFSRLANGVLADFELEGVLGADEQAVRSRIDALVRARKYRGPEEIERMTAAVASLLPEGAGHPAQIDRFMNWSDVREMSADGVAFGGHGADHWVLTSLTPQHAAREIAQARQVLERHLTGRVLAFSYPNGDWNRQVADMVRGAGYRVAFTTMRGREGGRFAMKRVNIHEAATASGPMFLARLVGFF
jgi:peptidoglycan/xylan/chitin deacetylase (PgdA/CDA1 family)